MWKRLDRALVGILVLAFVLRAGWVLLALLDPSDGEYFDMVWYHITALQIAAGKGVARLDGTPTAVWPPLYPALLAPLYLITDGSLLAGKLLNPFFGVLTTALVFDVGRRLVDRRAGLFAAALFAACPDDIFFSNFVMSEAAFAALFMANVWLFTLLQQRRPEPRPAAWLGLGLAAGVATLTRGIALAWLAVPIAIWLASVRPLRAVAPRAAWALLGLALVIAPWTIRNLVLMDYPILVASSLGRTLAHAHSPYETGEPTLKAFVYRRQIQKRFEHLPQPRMEVELMRAYTRLSLDYMVHHPGHELRIFPNRVRNLFRHGHAGLEIGRPKLPSGGMKPFFGPLRHGAIAGFADLYFYGLLLLGVLGLRRLFAMRDRTALIVPLGLGYFAFFHLVVFPADPRYHHSMLPLLALSAGVLLAALGARRREPAGAARIAAACLLALAPGALACTPEPPLNVVVISLDTTRADALGAYGQWQPTSPRIDAMAADGVLFEQVVASVPSTLPSHTTLFTGMQPYAHGVRGNAGYRLSDDKVTLAEVLHARGWLTEAVVAAPVLGHGLGLEQGFDRYRDPLSPETAHEAVEAAKLQFRRTRPAEEVTEMGLGFLRENAGVPFFLWLHYFDPHEPRRPPERFRQGLTPYHAEIRRVDHHVGLVLDELERLGLREHTIAVLTADHGEGLGEHGEPSHSFFVYDSTMRVPLIFWGASAIPRGVRVASLVRLVDVPLTILDLLGLPPLEPAQGRSLLPLFEDPAADLALTGYGESIEPTLAFGSSVLRFVRVGRWKYLHKLEPELYDLGSDPHELRNLAAEHPERVERLRARLKQLIAEAPSKPEDARVAMDEQELAELQALGYVAGHAALALDDERAALKVAGPDPSTRIDDLQALTTAWGHLASGRYEQALALLRPLEARNPESQAVLYALSETLWRAGGDGDLVPLLRRLIELEPDSARHLELLAQALQPRGELQEAERLLRRALDIDPCAVRSRVYLSELLRESGRRREQLALLEAGQDSCSGSAMVRNALAFALATSPEPSLRDGARAVQLAEAVVDESKGSNPGYADTLAAAYAELGDFERAIAEQKHALALLEARAHPPGVRESFERHLTAFEAERPVREP